MINQADPNQALMDRIASRRRQNDYKDPTRISAFMRGLGQGATLSTADEIFGSIGAVPEMLTAAFDRDPSTTMRGAMGEGIEDYRAKDEAAMDAHGKSFLAGEVVGTGVPLAAATLASGGMGTGAVGTAATVNRANRVRQLAQSGVKAFSTRVGPVTGGAAYGAAEGFGSGEGNFVERLPGTAVGTAFGAGAGKGADFGMKILGNVGTNLVNATGARQTMSNWPVVGGMFDSVEELAERQLRKKIPTGDDLTQAVSDLGTYPEEMVLDTSIGARDIARSAQNFGDEGSTISAAVVARKSGQEERVVERLKDALNKGGNRPNVTDVTEEISKRQRADAKPFYDEAYEATVPKSILDDHMKMPEFQKAYEKAQELWVARGEEGVMPAFDKLGDDVPLMMMDYVKRGLDDVLQVGRRGGGDSGIGGGINRAAIDRKNKMLAELDELVPAYGQARAIWAGGEAAQEALVRGQNAFKRSITADAVEREFQSLSPSEKAHWREGALDTLINEVEKLRFSQDATGGGSIGNIFQSTSGRRKIRLLFDDDATADEFIDAMAKEHQQHLNTAAIIGGSQTTDKIAMVDQIAEGTATPSVPQNWESMLKDVVTIGSNRNRQSLLDQKSDALAPMLTAKGQEGIDLVTRLAKEEAADPRYLEMIRRAFSRGAATQAADRGPTEAERRASRRLRAGGR